MRAAAAVIGLGVLVYGVLGAINTAHVTQASGTFPPGTAAEAGLECASGALLLWIATKGL